MPLRTRSGKRPIKVGKRTVYEAKRPTKGMVLVGISVGCLMGLMSCFRASPPSWTMAPLKRPIKRSIWEKVNPRVSKQGGGGVPTFFGKGLDCVADFFGTVPRRFC